MREARSGNGSRGRALWLVVLGACTLWLAMQNTLLTPRFYTTNFDEMDAVDVDPVRADWLLSVAIDSLHHDINLPPGQGRVALTAELFDRRSRTRIARRQFVAAVPAASADAPGAAAAMSQSLTQVFDALVPWLEAELPKAAAKAPS